MNWPRICDNIWTVLALLPFAGYCKWNDVLTPQSASHKNLSATEETFKLLKSSNDNLEEIDIVQSYDVIMNFLFCKFFTFNNYFLIF